MNHGGGPTLAVAVLVASGVLLLGLLVTAERVPQWVLCAGLYSVAVAIVYSFSLSGDRLFGWDIQQELRAFTVTMDAGTWSRAVGGDPYRAMLSITALPVVLARMTGISGRIGPARRGPAPLRVLPGDGVLRCGALGVRARRRSRPQPSSSCSWRSRSRCRRSPGRRSRSCSSGSSWRSRSTTTFR